MAEEEEAISEIAGEEFSVSWRCRSPIDCQASFETLYELLAHMRSIHSACLVTCGVDGCKLKFSKPSVWYWHIRRHHFAVYDLNNPKRTYSESVGRPESHDSEGIVHWYMY